jgi:UDP-N-acetylmuramate--alanine ligase
MEDVEQTFLSFMDRVPFYGMVVVCNDDERLRALLLKLRRRAVTYGTREDSDFRIVSAQSGVAGTKEKPKSEFGVRYRGKSLGDFRLYVPGQHNVLNATAAIAVGVGLDIASIDIRAALEKFRGVDRRFQLKGKVNEVSVVDDYGHHPTEIRATLAAARECGFRRIHVIFQPHRYTRTQLLAEEFATAFGEADSVLVLDIYAASESPILGVTGEWLARRICELGKQDAKYVASMAEAAEIAVQLASEGDMILTLGAGNVSQLGQQIVQLLEARQESQAARANR